VNRINLLPDGVIVRQRRARLLRAAAATAVVALTVGTAWGTTAYRSLRELSGQLAQAEARLAQEQQRTGKIDAVTAESNSLRTLLAQGERLANPVALHGAVTLLTNLLPESVALTRLTAEAPPVELKQSSKSASASRATHLSLEGLAVSDLELAKVVSELSAQRAFTNVKLVRSRPMTNGGITRFAFELTLDVPPAASAGDGASPEGKGQHGI
jgi:Tfp pilus assembly protein PilN